jgi:hypothetical protein
MRGSISGEAVVNEPENLTPSQLADARAASTECRIDVVTQRV